MFTECSGLAGQAAVWGRAGRSRRLRTGYCRLLFGSGPASARQGQGKLSFGADHGRAGIGGRAGQAAVWSRADAGQPAVWSRAAAVQASFCGAVTGFMRCTSCSEWRARGDHNLRELTGS